MALQYQRRAIREEKQLDKEKGAKAEAGDLISIAQASEEFGINKSLIRTAIKRGEVHSMQHPWGARVQRSEIAKLKAEHERIEHERTGR